MKIAISDNTVKQYTKLAPIIILIAFAVLFYLSKGFIVNNLGLKRYAVELFQSGEFNKSIPELEKVVLNQPGDHESRAMLALAYMFAGKNKEAEQQYDLLLEAAPENPEVLYKLGLANHNQGKHEESAKLLQKAVDLKTGNTIIKDQLVGCFTAINNFAGARKQLFSLLEENDISDEKRAFILEKIGDLYSREGNKVEARSAYDKALTYVDFFRIREKRKAI